mmetsp:Transcript_17404/g.22638  ORF Transcript_17404/g.22638 Transcript_17404/m.22638 type:complete len:90 (+) Transcript_17404:366-635(+)
MLDLIGKLDFFDVIVVGDECEHAKPHPIPYLNAMQALGVDDTERQSCLAFEDSLVGATAAVKSGALVFFLLLHQKSYFVSDVNMRFLTI